jgi:sugar phosphate permease
MKGRSTVSKETSSHLSHRWHVLGIGVAANAAVAAAFGGIPATAVFFRANYHIDNAAFGWIIAAMGLGLALSELPWGLVTDWLGDRRVLLTGLGLTGVVLALMALIAAPTAGHVPAAALPALGLLLVGGIGGSVNGSSGRAVMAWFQEGERGLAMSVRQMSVPAGGGLGALVLPATAEHFGFRSVYGLLASACFVITAFTWAWLHEPPRPQAVDKREPQAANTRQSPAAPRSPLRNSQVWRTVCGLGCLCVPQVVAVTFAAVFLSDVGHLGTAATSGSIVTFQVGAAITRVWSGRFTDRHKNRRPFLKACALMTMAIFAVLGLLVTLAATLPGHAGAAIDAAVLLMIAGGTVASTWHGIAYTELATIAGMKHVGTAPGLANTFAFGTYFVTPLAIPFILAASSWPGVWFAAAAAAFLAFLLFPAAVPAATQAAADATRHNGTDDGA